MHSPARISTEKSAFHKEFAAGACPVSPAPAAFRRAQWPPCRSFSCSHRFKEEALVAGKATSFSNKRRSRLALGIGCDHLAIEPIAFFIWKSEHRHGNIRRTIVAEFRKAHPYSVWNHPRNEISMMNTAIAFGKHSPSARIGLKRTKLVQVERVPNLACYWMSIRHCLPPYPIDFGISPDKSASRLRPVAFHL